MTTNKGGTNKSADVISDEELLLQFRKIEQLPANKKKLGKEFLDAFPVFVTGTLSGELL